MRKTALFLAAMMVLVSSLTGCGGKTATSENTQSSGANEQAAQGGDEKTYDIVYLSPSTASQFWTYVGIGIENAKKDLEESKGIKINFSKHILGINKKTLIFIPSEYKMSKKLYKSVILSSFTLVSKSTTPKALYSYIILFL